MPIRYQQTTDREIHDKVRRKHLSAIRELKDLGFEEYSFFGETVGALGFNPLGLTGFLGVLVSLFNEVSRVEGNLDVTIFNVVMASREYATYAGPFGLGVKFYTGFTDGTFLISANFDTPAIHDDKERVYKFAKAETVTSTWLSHKARVEKLCAQGKQKVEHLSFADYLQLMQREDAHLMKIKKHTEKSDLISPFISLSLGAAVMLMVWFFPRIVHELYPTCWFVRNVNQPSLLLILLLIPACLALSWFLARLQDQPFTANGIGTSLVGRLPAPGSRGYISTKWLVVVFLPLIPVRSYRVIDEQTDRQHQTRYLMEPLERLHWEQVKATLWRWILGYIVFILLVLAFGLWSFRECM
jgi:hypothetical protein